MQEALRLRRAVQEAWAASTDFVAYGGRLSSALDSSVQLLLVDAELQAELLPALAGQLAALPHCALLAQVWVQQSISKGAVQQNCFLRRVQPQLSLLA
jgi:hypothetical protein